jgi:antitoxin component of MazEF toxin-antitoxin module
MTTIKIELPDDQAAALKAKAEAEGLSLEDWFRRRADQEIRPRRSRYTLDELVEQCDPEAPLSAEDREWMDSPAVGREAL